MMFTPEEMVQVTGGRWLGAIPVRGPACFGHDTRHALDGGAYVAIEGEVRDGHDFLEDAVKAGATMAIVEKSVESTIYA